MKMVDTKKVASRAAPEGVRVNRTGRRTYTSAYKLAVVRQCSEPGVSVAAIAMARGINANLVRRWMVRHQRTLVARAPQPPTMLPITIEATSKPADGGGGRQLVAASRPRSPAGAAIEIELYGARIHLRGGVDAEALRCVLDVLARR